MLKTLVSTLHTVVMGSSLSQQSAIDTIAHWRAKPAHALIFDSDRPELYLQAVDRLLQQQQQSNGSSNELLAIAIERLKREFKAVLRHRQLQYPAGQSSTMEYWSTMTDSTAYLVRYEDYVGYDIPGREVVVYLRNIVKIMKKANGSVSECVDMYKSVRYKFLESQFQKLHFHEVKIGDSLRRFSWDELKVRIDTWVRISKICVEIFFRKEKQLCEEIFGKEDSDSVFVDTVKEFGVGLFSFAKLVSRSNQSYDKMGAVLGLYGTFWSLLGDVGVLFGSESGRVIRNMTEDTLVTVQNEVERMLTDLEKAVLIEIQTFVDDAGGVCKTTKVVMELIDHVVEHREMLNDMIKSGPSLDLLDAVSIQESDLGDLRNCTFVDLHLRFIVVALRRNAEKKSKSYQDLSLVHLFTMNNVRYIVQKIEESNELRQMVGNSCLRDLNEIVEHEMNAYCENTCSKFSDCFQEEGMYVTRCFGPSLSKPALRKRLKTFNSSYEELKSFHTRWTVHDSQLRERICSAMCGKLVHKYKDLLGKIGSSSESQKNIKYSASELEELVSEKLFACN